MSSIADVLEGRARWAMVEGDNREVLPTLPDRSVAHVITDPPYSKDLYSRTRINKGSGVRKTGRPYARSELKAERSALQLASNRIGAIDDVLEATAAEFLRIANRWIIVFSDMEISHRWRGALGRSYLRTGIWVKPDAMPQVTGDRPAQGFEPASIAHRPGKKRWNGGGHSAVWTHCTSKGHERPDHPCPKPVSLMLELVELFSDPDDVVIDPFAGSGTTGLACLRLGRRFIGVERDAAFAAVARERLEAESQGLTLRAARAGQRSLFAEI